MKANGFTLIELLSVIVILSLLTLIAIPNIVNSVKNSKERTDNVTLELIYDASKLYIENNINKFPKINGNKYIIELKDLIEEDLLATGIKLSNGKNDITNTKCLQVTYNNGYKYELKDRGTCEEKKIICKSVTNQTKTTGNVPKGNYESGDEYICEVKPGTKYHFFVLSSEDNKVNLIMDSNITKFGEPLKEFIQKDYNYYAVKWSDLDTNEKGPNTAVEYLKKATNNWVYINTKTFEFIYNNHSNEVFSFESRARLATLEEMENNEIGCKTHSSKLEGLATCPLWTVNYLGFKNASSCPAGVNYEKYKAATVLNGLLADAYWLMDANNSEDQTEKNNKAYAIGACGDIDADSDTTVDLFRGIRPVISVSKTNIE